MEGRARRTTLHSKLRSVLLFTTAIAFSLTWPQSGRTDSCTIERGLDPLDVLADPVRHNVWLVLDSSSSMDNPFGDSEETRLEAAKRILTKVLDDLVDSSGRPMVNWAYATYDHQDDDDNQNCTQPDGPDADTYPDEPAFCHGLDDASIHPPPECGGDNTDQIQQHLDALESMSGTPLGVAFDDIGRYIRGENPNNKDYVADLQDDQLNVVIHITDGSDNCECEKFAYDDEPDFNLGPNPNDNQVPDGNLPFLRIDDDDPDILEESDADRYTRAYNAGLKGEEVLRKIDPDLDGTKGHVFMVGMGLSSGGKKRTNHIAWTASGAGIDDDNDGNRDRPDNLLHSAFFADEADEFEVAIRTVLSRFGGVTGSYTLSNSTVGSVKELIPVADPSIGLDQILDDDGEADDHDVRSLRGRFRNNILFKTSIDLPGFQGHLKAFNIFKVDPDTGQRVVDLVTRIDPETGQPVEALREVWDAGVLLSERDAESREIYFSRDYSVGGPPPPTLPFETNVVTPSDLDVEAGDFAYLDPDGEGARTDQDARDIVVNVIRGKRLVSFDPLVFESREANNGPIWKLWDSSNVAPAIVQQPPDFVIFDPPGPPVEYANFFEERTNRLSVVYMGSNGGMMHAIRADNGHEIYGYIPSDMLPRLKDLVAKVIGHRGWTLVIGNDKYTKFNHEFHIAASAHVMDAYLDNTPGGLQGWRTVLAFGRGRGGKFVTGMDVSEVGDWDGQDHCGFPNPALGLPCDVMLSPDPDPPDSETQPVPFQPPDLLFNVGNQEGVIDNDGSGQTYDGLGETWSEPRIGRVSTADGIGQWLLFMGSGYGCVDSDEGQWFYVLNLEDGTIHSKFELTEDAVNPGDPGVDQNALVAPPVLFNPHTPGSSASDNYVTRVYIGDLQGFVHGLNTESNDKTEWTFDTIYEITGADGAHDQPITAPVAVLNFSASNEVGIFVGTGGDSRVERNIGETFKIVGLMESLDTGQITELHSFDVPSGERVRVPPVTARNAPTDGVVFFATSVSNVDQAQGFCIHEFTSSLFAFGATSGFGTYDLDPETGGIQSEVRDIEGRIAGMVHKDEHLYVTKSGKFGTPGETEIRGKDTFREPPMSGSGLQILVESFGLSPF